MKNSKMSLVSIAVLSAVLAGCNSAPVKPVAYVPPPTQATAPLAAPPATVTSNIPTWYISPPASTETEIYTIGTAISRDMAMSGHKAQIDAEAQLANKITGSIDTLTKDYKRDVGDEYAQSTEVVTNKSATNTKIIGEVVVNRQVTAEGGGFRTYVLLKFPVGNANHMLQSYENKKTFTGTRVAAEAELAKKAAADREPGIVTTPIIVRPIPTEPEASATKYDNDVEVAPIN